MNQREQTALLARQAQQGNQGAFNELYRLTRDRAYFVALSVAKDEQDALDIVQDSFLKAWQNINTLEKPEQFPAWLKQIAGNTAKDYLKRRNPMLFAQQGVESETDIIDLQAEKDDGYIPDAAMDTAETRRFIMGIVNELPEDQRLCVLMFYYEDMDLAEIADALQIPRGTVQSRLHRARRKISDGVQALEKQQGTKFYSAAPIPLLIWLLRGTAVETSKTLPPVILGSAAVGTAAITGGGILASIALPKLVAGIAATLIIGGGAATAISTANRQNVPLAIAEPTVATTSSFTEQAAIEALRFTLPQLPALPSESNEVFFTQPEPVTFGVTPSTATTTQTVHASTTMQTMLTVETANPTTSTTYTQPETVTLPSTTQATATAITSATFSAVYTTAPETTTMLSTTQTTTVSTTSVPTTTTTTAPQRRVLESINGVRIEYDDGVLPEGVVFNVRTSFFPVFTTRVINPTQNRISARYDLYVTYNGARVQPQGGSVTIWLPIPAGEPDVSELVVEHRAPNIGLQPVAFRVEGNYLVFETTYI